MNSIKQPQRIKDGNKTGNADGKMTTAEPAAAEGSFHSMEPDDLNEQNRSTPRSCMDNSVGPGEKLIEKKNCEHFL